MTNGNMITDTQRLNFLEAQKVSLFEWWRAGGSFWTVRTFHTKGEFETPREAIDDAMRIYGEKQDDDGSQASS